jgi:hypothetical protein
MAQRIAVKPMGSPTASARTCDPVFDGDWLSSVETGAWFDIVGRSSVKEVLVETSLRKMLFDEHTKV